MRRTPARAERAHEATEAATAIEHIEEAEETDTANADPPSAERDDATDTPTPQPVAATNRATPTPAPQPIAPTPTPRAAPRPPPPPTLDARVRFTNMDIDGSLPPSAVSRALDRTPGDLRECYQQAARRAGRDAAGAVSAELTIDEMGAARRVSVRGEPLPGVAACTERVLKRVRTRQRPDTGRVRVSFRAVYTPVTR